MQTLEGELRVEIPQVRQAAEPFVSKLFASSTKGLCTEPLRAMVTGAFVRGCRCANVRAGGAGQAVEVDRPADLHRAQGAFEQFRRRDLYDVDLAALFLDGVPWSPAQRAQGGRAGRRGLTEAVERVLLSVVLGMRDSHEEWLSLGRDVTARGLGAPLLIVADGAPGPNKAVEQCWPARTVSTAVCTACANLLAKLPERARERVRQAYWQALDDATDQRDAQHTLQALVAELDKAGYTAATTMPRRRSRRARRYPTRHRRQWRTTNLLQRSLAGSNAAPRSSAGPR